MWGEATQTPLQLVPLPLALAWYAEHLSQAGIGADDREMLEALLFHMARIAAEKERRG
jgi:hypothetical protein